MTNNIKNQGQDKGGIGGGTGKQTPDRQNPSQTPGDKDLNKKPWDKDMDMGDKGR